uniref:Uncharacterized protein n=1 Tax=Macrostomum lignano TaxID=282301 RepID=A0A1I8FBJ1_9PLAT
MLKKRLTRQSHKSRMLSGGSTTSN